MNSKSLNKNKNKRIERIKGSRVYAWMQNIQKYLDDYYLDAVAGLIPGGIGDIISSLFAVIYAWFAATKVRSLPLTLAIINNSLRDVFLGLIPFYVGDIIDFFHRANHQNMALVQGFVDGDEKIIREVNRKAWQSGILIIISILLIAVLLWIAFSLTAYLWKLIMP